MSAYRSITTFVLAIFSLIAGAQCPQLFDGQGVPSSQPYWFSCSGNNFTLLIASPQSIGAFTVDWGDGSALYNGASLVPPQSVSHVYTSTVDTFIVVFTEMSSGCTVQGVLVMEESTSASIQIPIGGLTQVCAPQAVEFINSSTNVSENTVFSWDFGDGSPPLVFDHTNWGQTISHTYLQGTVSCETQVTLSAENYCNTLQGGPSTATFNPIRVWDIDSANISASATLLCYPDTVVTFLNTTLRNCLQQGNIYQRFEYWNFGDYWGQGQDSIIDWTPWPPTFPHTIAYPGIGTYQVMMLDSNYCGIDTAYITINIVPPPTVTLSVNPDTICAGGTAYFNQTTAGGANSFQWNFGTGGGWQNTGPGDQAQTYYFPGTYTVYYAASIQGATPGCTDTASVDLVVLPSPTAQFVLDNDAACDSLTVNIVNTSINAVQSQWDMGNGNTSNLVMPPPQNYATVGSYDISLTVTNALGCQDTETQQVNVYEPPQVIFIGQNVCQGELGTFYDQTVTDPGNPITSWNWDLGDGSTSTDTTPSHIYVSGGIYTVTLTVYTPYCSGTGSMTVNVEDRPVAAFTADVISGCSPLTVNFSNGSINATTYDWYLGDGNVATAVSPTHTFTNITGNDTVYTVVLVASTGTGCSDTTAVDITVSPAVVAMFEHNAIPGCAPLNVTFTNTSTGASNYVWDFGDGSGSVQPSPTHTYINNTLFLDMNTVTLIAYSSNGCTDTVTQQIVVYPAPNFAFVTEPDSGCSPLTVTFPSVVGAVSYDWDFGDGTFGTGPSPQHTYFNNSTNDLSYTVQLVAANAFGCMDTTTASVTVLPNPTAQFIIDTVAGCHPLLADIINTSIGADQYTWTYGDGQTSNDTAGVHQHTWYNYSGPNAQIYNITLLAQTDQGCSNTTTGTVQVYPLVTASFVADTVGCSPFDPDITNTSTGAVSYAWDLGDGTTSSAVSPAHLYLNQSLSDQVYPVDLTATSSFGCTATATTNVTVHPAPLAQFTPDVLAGCGPLDVLFVDNTIGSQTQSWNFGDGSFAIGAVGDQLHTYDNFGASTISFPVQLISTSAYGCKDTTTTQIAVYPKVTAGLSSDTAGCSPLTVNFTNQSQGATNYLWEMGDGTVLVTPNPSYTYINNTSSDVVQTVTLVAESAFGCTDTIQQDIHIHAVPFANFQATPFSQQYPNATINLVNNSGPGTWNYAWSYGDGNGSSAQDPLTHTYGTWGSFDVRLIVSSPFCSDTADQVVEIIPPLPTADFIGSGEGCVPLTIQFINTSLQGLSYQWNFGDGGTSNLEDPMYTYYTPGVYTVSLTVTGVGGGVNTAVHVDSVIVHPSAIAYFVLQPNEVVVPNQPVFFYNLSGNADSYIWDFGDGSSSTQLNPTHYYQQAGLFDVNLIANNAYNCPDTFALQGAVVGISSGGMQFPNAFTPNSNGPTDGTYDAQSFENDFFFPVHEGVEEYHLQIYNRWGEMVFESFDVRKGWDGYYRGLPAKQDVYVWKARAKFSDGNDVLQSGDVTLLR